VFATTVRGLLIAAALLAFAAPAHAAVSVLDNGVVRVGVDLSQGGKLTWLSRARGADAGNLVYEAEQSYYAEPGWHAFQDPATVIAQSNNGHTLYTRAVDIVSGASLETWITLHGNAVVVRNRLTNFRAGSPPPVTTWQELPALYTDGTDKLVTYEGPHPWTGARVADLGSATPAEDLRPTEHWAALLDDSNFGVGLVEPDILHMSGFSRGQLGYPSGYLAGVRPELLDGNIVYAFAYTLVVGTVRQIRAYAYAHRPDPRPSYVFAHDREHFTEANATDAGFPIDGALRVRLDQWDPQLVGPETIWAARRVPRLYIRGAWHTRQKGAQLFWSRLSGTFNERQSRAFTVIPDGSFKTYRVDLFQSADYAGLIDRIRLDPVAGLDTGAWVDITCISFKPCPINRAAEQRLESDGGRIPLTDTFDTLDQSLWSITGNSTGASVGVENGELLVTIAAGAKALPGQTYVGAGVYSRCRLSGNFDVQVSYVLKEWPAGSGVHLNFSVGNGTLFRNDDWLSFYFPPLPGPPPVMGLGQSGTLRLLRVDGVLRGYYRNADGDWVQVDAAGGAGGPANIGLSLSTNGDAGAQDVAAAFDDFRVTSGQVNCQ
jgi:hypothetical protein